MRVVLASVGFDGCVLALPFLSPLLFGYVGGYSNYWKRLKSGSGSPFGCSLRAIFVFECSALNPTKCEDPTKIAFLLRFEQLVCTASMFSGRVSSFSERSCFFACMKIEERIRIAAKEA